MHLGNLVAAALALASGALADCYPGGRRNNWSPERPVIDIQGICVVYFTGPYAPGEIREYCLYDVDGERWDLAMGYLGTERFIEGNIMQCFAAMSDMRKCEYGGYLTHANWYYRLDPNTNDCGQPSSG